LVDESGEASCVLDGDVGEDLAVQFDASLLQAVDQLRVAEVIQLGGSRDAHDPQRTELALLLLAACVGKLQAALDGLLGCLIELGLRKEVSTGSLQNLLAAVTPLGTAFYAGHNNFSILRSVMRLEAGGALPDGAAR